MTSFQNNSIFRVEKMRSFLGIKVRLGCDDECFKNFNHAVYVDMHDMQGFTKLWK